MGIATRAQPNIPLERAEGLVLVLDTPKGRGVFASTSISAKTIIEVCPVLIFDDEDNKRYISKSVLRHYTYNWPSAAPSSKSTRQALALGLGSLFNHSTSEQNVSYTRDVDKQTVTYMALRDIVAGEELCINYGRLWFSDIEEQNSSQEEIDGMDMLAKLEI